MRITFAGAFKSRRTGSWQCRGQQLADAMTLHGAETHTATRGESIDRPDVLVIVKRPDPAHLNEAKRRGIPVIFDPLDWWPQPEGNAWDASEARERMQSYVRGVAPDGVVCPTRAMAVDLAWRTGPTLVLPHHARPHQRSNSVREKVRTVGYEGREQYLGPWRAVIDTECTRRGWRFVVNPKGLADVDILVALRGGEWRGVPTDRWKSNVKLANAQVTGTPVICTREAAYVETASGGEVFVDDLAELTAAFDGLTDCSDRRQCASLLKASAHCVALSTLARRYRDWIETMVGMRKSTA